MRINHYLLLLFSFAIASIAVSQPIERRFVNYSLEDGLSQSTIFDIKQDEQGYIWLATADGINVYDGSHFEVYKKNPKDSNTLSDNFVHSVLPFNNGKVWAISNDRVINEIDIKSKKVKKIASLSQISEDMYAVKEMLLGPNDNIWLSTYENGILVLDKNGHVVKTINKQSGLINSNSINDVQITPNEIWVATGNGVSRINKDLKSTKHFFEGRPIGSVHTFKNSIYLSFFDTESVIKSLLNNIEGAAKTILTNDIIINICNEKDGTIWLGSNANGLYELKDNNLQHYQKNQSDRWSLIDNNIFKVFTDNNDNVLIGTYSGLSIYKKAYNIFKLYRNSLHSSTLSSNKIYDIYEDLYGAIWFVNYDGAIDKLENNVFTPFKDKIFKNFKNIRPRSIYQTKKGEYFLGTLEKGLFKFYPDKDKVVSIKSPEFSIGVIREIIEYETNKLLIAHDKGIMLYDINEGVFKGNIIDQEFTAYDLLLRGKTLYAASFAQGLFEIDLSTGSFIKYKTNKTLEGISSNNIMCIVPISKDTLALGTYGGGVSLFNTVNKTFLNYSESDGLRNNSVYGILKDKQNNLWLSTNVGISKWMASRKQIKNYDLPIQLQSLEFNEDAFLKSSDGTFYFGGVNGVNFFKPSEIKPNNQSPQAVISAFYVGDEKKYISNAIALGKVINLKSKENYIQFYYNALRMTIPEKTQFYYRLKGVEDDWQLSIGEEYVRYNNLGPGDYTFMLRACNEDGFCDEQIQELKFCIATPFYKTFWFLALLLLAFFAGLYWLFKVRTNNLRTEYTAKMTNAELRALRIQMNPHFIFNSLNSIQYYVLNSDSKTAYKYLTKFSSLMRRTLQHSKENFLPLKEELESLKIYLELENMRLENSLEINIVSDPEIDQERTLVPTLFMQPFAENAIIHGLLPKEGRKKIEIKIEKKGKGIRCIIKDDGIGRNASRELNKKRNRSHQSTALVAIENRIKILNSSANINIKMTIEDLYQDDIATGTKVILDIS